MNREAEIGAEKPLSPTKRLAILTLGHVAVAVGLIGLLVPVMPTSPFIIFASVCYARTSERFHLLLLRNRYFGAYVRDWHERRCLQRQAKYAMIAVIVISFSITIAGWVAINPWQPSVAMGVALISALAAFAVFLMTRIPSCPQKNSDS